MLRKPSVTYMVICIMLKKITAILSFIFSEILQVKESSKNDNTAKNALYSIRFLCGFLLPFLVILCCYILAGIGISRTHLSGKSRPLRILAALVFSFFLCWAPYHCLLLAKMVDKKSHAVKVGLPIAKGLAYFNSCINPMLYFCMGLDMRQRFRQSLSGIYRRALMEDGQTVQSQEGNIEDSCNSVSKTKVRHRPVDTTNV